MAEENALTIENLDSLPSLGDVRDLGNQYFDYEEDDKRAPRLDSGFIIIKVKNGAQRFKIGDEDDLHATVGGVIVHFAQTRTFWEKSYGQGGGNQEPDCRSNDGITPDPQSPKVQCNNCAACSHNKWETDEEGNRGKKCRESLTLFIWHPTAEKPFMLRASTMNRKSVADFIHKCGEVKIPKEMFVVSFSLRETKNKKGVAYDELVITPKKTVAELTEWFSKNRPKGDGSNWSVQDIVQEIKKFKDDNQDLFDTSAAINENETVPQGSDEEERKSESGTESVAAADSSEEPSTDDFNDGMDEEPPF